MNLEKEVFDISLKDIIPNRFQPREIFEDEALQELSESIKKHGVIQPIIVRKIGDKYEIIAGERRFRASKAAGKETIPALVRDIDDKEAAKIALLENLQRSNLTPIEEAKTYQTILKIDNITQDELAANLGKSQSTIANKLRLLSLAEEVQTALLNSQISERHARSLLGLDRASQIELLNKTLNQKLTVRQLDEEVLKLTGKAPNIGNDEVTEEKKEEIPMNEMNNMQMPNQNTTQQGSSMTPEMPNQTSMQQEPQIQENQRPMQNAMNNIPNTVQPQVQNNIETQPSPNQINENIQPGPIQNNEIQQPETNNLGIPEINNMPLPEVKNSTIPPRQENIFDKLRVKRDDLEESKFEITNPMQGESIDNNQPNEQSNINNIYDIRFAINNFRQAIQNTEKFGFKVTTKENETDDKYQIVIEIDKK